MPKFHGRQQISTDVDSSILEFRRRLFRCQLAFGILNYVNNKQPEFGIVCVVDIVSAVQENFKWLKSEWNSFQGRANSKFVFQAWYEMLVFFIILNLVHFFISRKKRVIYNITYFNKDYTK